MYDSDVSIEGSGFNDFIRVRVRNFGATPNVFLYKFGISPSFPCSSTEPPTVLDCLLKPDSNFLFDLSLESFVYLSIQLFVDLFILALHLPLDILQISILAQYFVLPNLSLYHFVDLQCFLLKNLVW